VRLSLSRASVPEIEAGARVLAELTNELVRGPALLAVRNYL